MRIRKSVGAALLGLGLLTMVPSVTEAAHRCRPRVEKSSAYYYDDGGYYGDDVDYRAPYVSRHGSGRVYYESDRPTYYDRGYYAPRYVYRPAPVYSYSYARPYHYHGRTRCYAHHRSGLTIHLGF
jgi:hypothetical protein